MMTMAQVRNVVFAVLNQSKFSLDLDEVIQEASSIRQYTRVLNDQDRQLENKLKNETDRIEEARKQTAELSRQQYTELTKKCATNAEEIKQAKERIVRQKDRLDEETRRLDQITE
jgi:chromosome segregation ATPase